MDRMLDTHVQLNSLQLRNFTEMDGATDIHGPTSFTLIPEASSQPSN